MVQDQICKDIIRTNLPKDHEKCEIDILFGKKIEEVERVLKTQICDILEVYSLIEPDIGYIQGMNSIAASVVYN